MRLGFEYVAAFVDCDGTIVIVKQKCGTMKSPQYYAKVSFYSQNLGVLHDLADTVGGTIQFVPSRDAYELALSPRVTLDCLREIRTFLRIKRDQADLAIRLQEHVVENRGPRWKDGKRQTTEPKVLAYRESMFLEMKRLNHRDSQSFKENRVNSAKTLRRATPSRAAKGKGIAEGVTVRETSPNSNSPQERPARKGRHDLSSAKPIEINALKCG